MLGLTASGGKNLERCVVQYNETDWQFLKRLASYTGAVLVPDASADKPKFWFGVPEGKAGGVLEDFHYSIKRDLSSYLNTSENYSDALDENDFTYYEVESVKVLNLGDKVSVKEKTLVVAKVTAIMEAGIFKYQYIFKTQKGIYQNSIQNNNIIGAAIEGKVIDIAKDTVKVHLEIDDNQSSEEAYWFPYSSFYAAEGETGWYCMPEKGDHVKLYFPSGKEEEATAISSVRRGGGSAKTSDPSTKYIGNSSGKELKLGGNDMSLTAKEGSVFIKLHEENGIEINSDSGINLGGGGGLVIYSDLNISYSNKECVLDNGEDGSDFNAISGSVSNGKTLPVQGFQYIEAIGSGSCLFNTSKFTMNVTGENSTLSLDFTESSHTWHAINSQVVSSNLRADVSVNEDGDQYKILVIISDLWCSESWMENSASIIHNCKLNDLVIPGTHDSGTYAITAASTLAPSQDIPQWVNAVYALGLPVGLTVMHVISNWAKTQGCSITQQLEKGIRYLDLRVVKNNNDYFLCHSLYSINVDELILQVNDFTNAHPKEIIILDFNNLYQMNTLDENTPLIEKMLKVFGNKLAPKTMSSNSTLDELWNSGLHISKQVNCLSQFYVS